MGNAKHNLQLIKSAIEGLRRLDSWEDSEQKREMIKTRDSMSQEKLFIKVPPFLEHKRVPRYADPWGNEISLFEWAVICESCNRQIENTFYELAVERIVVSTVWVGLNMGYFGDMKIFETMVFGKEAGDLDRYMDRYGTLEGAIEGHAKACKLVEDFLAAQRKKEEAQ